MVKPSGAIAAAVAAVLIAPALLSPSVSGADDTPAPPCKCQFSADYPDVDYFEGLWNGGPRCDTHPVVTPIITPTSPTIQIRARINPPRTTEPHADALVLTPEGNGYCDTFNPAIDPPTLREELTIPEAMVCITAINEACRNSGAQ